LAVAIGRSPRFIQRLEHGNDYAKATPEIKKRIASALQSSEELLFPDQGGAE
jgi:hypothetical protein